MDIQTFEKALHFAITAHKGQCRKNGLPYIYHPLAVLTYINQFKDSKNALLLGACSLLHDTVEDCGVTLNTIANKFGYQVASIVQELTSDKEAIKKIGKTAYLCDKLTKISSYALAIKLCDRYHNVIDLGKTHEEFRTRYINETRSICRHLTASKKLTKTHIKIIRAIERAMWEYLPKNEHTYN